MSTKSLLTQEQMLVMLLQGHTYAQVAAVSGVSRQRVQQILSPPAPVHAFVIAKYFGVCADCGIFVGRTGHVHHDGSSLLDDYNDINGLVLLCRSCHRKRHSGCLSDLPSSEKSVMLVGDTITVFKCLRCGHEWASRNPHPVRCAKCKTPYWDREKKERGGQ